mgnify:CR=1 FL=1
MLCGLLQSNQIDAHIRGAREYAGLVTGTDLGRYEIMVPKEDFKHAEEIYKTTKKPMLDVVQPGDEIKTTRSPQKNLLRSLVSAIVAAVVIYLLFGSLLRH